jgi:hypothetical protein
MGNKHSQIENMFLKNDDDLNDMQKMFKKANDMAENSFPDATEYIKEAGKNPEKTSQIMDKYIEKRSKARMDSVSAINADIFMSANTLQTTNACWVSLAYKLKISSSIISQFKTALDTGNIESRAVTRFIKMVQKAEHEHYKKIEKGFVVKVASDSLGLMNNLYRGVSSRTGKSAVFFGGYMMSSYSPELSSAMMAYGPLTTLCVLPDTIISRKSVMLGICLVIGALAMGISGTYSYVLRNGGKWTLKVLRTTGTTNVTTSEEAIEWATNWLTNGFHDMALNGAVAKGIGKGYNNTVEPWIKTNVLETKVVRGVRQIHNTITIPAATFIEKSIDVIASNAEVVKKSFEIGSKALDFIQSDSGMKAIDTFEVITNVFSDKAETIQLLMDGAQNLALLVDSNAETINNAADLAGGLKSAAKQLGIISSDTDKAQERLSIAAKSRVEDLQTIYKYQNDVEKQNGVKSEEEYQELLDKIASRQGTVGGVSGTVGTIGGGVQLIGQ